MRRRMLIGACATLTVLGVLAMETSGQSVKTPTTTRVYARVSPSTVNQEVILTAVVGTDGETPTGQVEFFGNGVSLGTGPLFIAEGAAMAVMAVSAAEIGLHAIAARYAGDETHEPSESPRVLHLVVPAPQP